jgi:transposase
MSKKDFGARNWRLYNQQLVKRGDITCWIDIKSWRGPNKCVSKRGRPLSYSNSAIMMMLTLKAYYRLTLRSCQGFVKSLFRLMKFEAEVPDYSTICRRQKSVLLPKLPQSEEPIHLVIDSSGLKIFGEGEWKVRMHGWSKHRMWQKLHLGVDESSKLIVSAILTGNNCGDDKMLKSVLERYKGPIKQVSLDGAYDSHDCYSVVNGRGAKAVIPPQPNPRHKPKTLNNLHRPRDFMIYEIQTKGRAQWKKDHGYHRRSLAENAFYRLKKILGNSLSARTFENQVPEALIRCHMLNKMMKMNSGINL